MLEQGTYFGRLVEIGPAKLKNDRKTPYVFVCWRVTHVAQDGEWAALEEPVLRESRWWVTPKAEPYTMDRLVKLGFNGDFDRPDFRADPHPVNDGVQLACRHERRQGQTYEHWDLGDAAGGGGRERGEEWSADAKRRFKAKYATRTKATAKPAGGPSAPPPRAAQDEPPDEPGPDDYLDPDADVADDEIPF